AALVEANRVLVDPRTLAHVGVIGAHAVEGALLERHARAGGALLTGKCDQRLATEAGTQVRGAGRDRIIEHDPGHVALGFDLEPHARDVTATPGAGLLLSLRGQCPRDDVPARQRRPERDRGAALESDPGLARPVMVDHD